MNVYIPKPTFDDLCMHSMDLDDQDNFSAGVEWARQRAANQPPTEIGLLRELEALCRGYGPTACFPIFKKLDELRKR